MTKIFAAAILSAVLMLTPIYGDDDHKGQKGDKGEKGDRGDKGDKGDRGDKGLKGDKGDRGEPGMPGARGPAGAPGPMGPVGPAGPAGPRGTDGKSGAPGRDGHEGKPGVSGPTGPQGLRGVDGVPGTIGPIGPAGPQGKPAASRDFTSTPDFKDCTVLGEPFTTSTDADGSVRFNFIGSKTTALHGYRCPLPAAGSVEIAVTTDHALTASGLLFGVESPGGVAGLVEDFIVGKHAGGFLVIKSDGSIPTGSALQPYPETATVWFRIVNEPGKVTFLYSATGKHWSAVASSVALASAPYFYVLGQDLGGNEPYSFAVRHMRRF